MTLLEYWPTFIDGILKMPWLIVFPITVITTVICERMEADD